MTNTPNPISKLLTKWCEEGALPSSAHWNDSKKQAAIELEAELQAWNEFLWSVDSSDRQAADIRELILGVQP